MRAPKLSPVRGQYPVGVVGPASPARVASSGSAAATSSCGGSGPSSHSSSSDRLGLSCRCSRPAPPLSPPPPLPPPTCLAVRPSVSRAISSSILASHTSAAPPPPPTALPRPPEGAALPGNKRCTSRAGVSWDSRRSSNNGEALQSNNGQALHCGAAAARAGAPQCCSGLVLCAWRLRSGLGCAPAPPPAPPPDRVWDSSPRSTSMRS